MYRTVLKSYAKTDSWHIICNYCACIHPDVEKKHICSPLTLSFFSSPLPIALYFFLTLFPFALFSYYIAPAYKILWNVLVIAGNAKIYNSSLSVRFESSQRASVASYS
jgi:hypothetical protein